MKKNYRELMVGSFEGLIGKTISYVSFDTSEEKLLLRLTDGTACIFQAQREMEEVVKIDFLGYFDDSDYREVGIMSEEEYEENCEARRKSNAALKENADKKLYEELKKKFGD